MAKFQGVERRKSKNEVSEEEVWPARSDFVNRAIHAAMDLAQGIPRAIPDDAMLGIIISLVPARLRSLVEKLDASKRVNVDFKDDTTIPVRFSSLLSSP
jgi:hypothetical protein